MKRIQNLLILLLLISLSAVTIVTARDLRNLGKEAFIERSALSASDTIPTHLINWPLFFGVQQTGEIDASFDCFGNFGTAFGLGPYDFIYAPHFPSYVTPPTTGIEHLFGGAIWIGGIVGDDTLVSVGADGWQFINELFPPEYPNSGSITLVEDYPADFSMRAEFTDSNSSTGSYTGFDPFGHRPLNIKVSNRSHAWHSSPENGTIIYDLVITNIGDKTIKEGYVGLYFDCDVGNDPFGSYWDDFAGSLRDYGIGYAIDNDGDFYLPTTSPATKIFALKILETSFLASDTNFNWWVPNGDALRDYGPRQRGTTENPFRDFGTGGTGTPEGDANKYYMMSFNEWDYDLIYSTSVGDSSEIWQPQEFPYADLSGSFDIRFLMSVGPFQLKPDSSIRISFATFTGDSVHNLPENFQDNLPYDPDLYLSNLNFDDVLANSAISDSLGQLLLDPNLPPLGFQIVNKNTQQPELQWDPWVYNEVTGYEILIEDADLSQLPQPGVVPPWWAPAADKIPITLGRTYRYSIDNLNKDRFYLAAIANKTSTGTGQLSIPIQFRLNPRPGAVQLPSQYVFAKPGQPLKLKWELNENSAVDHINIYKFSDSSDAKRVYHAFYDEGYRFQFIQPKDSFFVDEKTYYYYAMVPFAVAAAEDTMFIVENFLDGNAYVIAAADEFGFESEYTRPIVAYNVTEQNREILLLTNSFVLTPHEYTYFDSISTFYSSILQGFDYEIFSFSDSFAPSSCPRQDLSCLDWQDLMPYKMVIIDDRLSEGIFGRAIAGSNTLDALFKFQANGGKIVYFGRFSSFAGGGTHIIDGVPQYLTGTVVTSQLFGINGMFAGSERYYYNNASPPYVDSLFGFIRAQHKEISLPSLDADLKRDPFTIKLRELWPMETPPAVATFIPNDDAIVTHLFQSAFPTTSVQQSHNVGIRLDLPKLNTQTYTFGFHLWYMNSRHARRLIRAIWSSEPFDLAAKTIIEPALFHFPKADSRRSEFTNIYVGDIEQSLGLLAGIENSIIVNNAIKPVSVEFLISHQDFDNQVLKIEIPTGRLLSDFIPFWDTMTATYSVSGTLADGRDFKALGSFMLIGHQRGDLNGDGMITVTDLTELVGLLFRMGKSPEPLELSDVNSDGSVNIIDLIKLVDYIFRGIPL